MHGSRSLQNPRGNPHLPSTVQDGWPQPCLSLPLLHPGKVCWRFQDPKERAPPARRKPHKRLKEVWKDTWLDVLWWSTMFRLPVFLVLQHVHNISSNAFQIFPLECTLCFPASDFNNTIMQYIIPFLTIYLYIHYAKFVLYSLHCNQYIIVYIYVICTKYNTIQ